MKIKKIIKANVILLILSKILIILTVSFFIDILVAIIYGESINPFLFPGILTLSMSLLIESGVKRGASGKIINNREAYITVFLSWFLITLIGTLPFIISGHIPRFADAFFESVSGFTTTGSSVVANIEALPKSILFWRSFTHWIGGIGIILLVVIIMPSFHLGSYQLLSTESSITEKIHPRTKSIGYTLISIYLGLTFFEIVLLLMGEMDLFDAICHSFGTIATGGFSTKNASIAYYSPYIQYVILIFMLLSGTSFVGYYYIIRRSLFKNRKNDEISFYIFIVFLFSILLTGILFMKTNRDFETSFRESAFQVVSIVTTTGFATSDYIDWPTEGWVIIFFLLFAGGCTGSTAGGIKMARHLIIIKNLSNYIKKIISPNAILPIRLNNRVLSQESSSSIFSYVSVYLLLFLAGSIIMVFLGNDFKTSSSAIATAMAGIGPGIGKIGPVGNFAGFSDAGKLILSLFMIIGRLEIFSFMIILNRSFWKV